MSADVAVVSELLRQWLAGPPPAESLRERAGLALEHLVEATQVRFPAVSDLARGVVFRWFAQPLLRRNRAEVYAAVRERPALPGPRTRTRPDRAERIQAMVASAEPLVRLIGQRIGTAAARDHAPLLEVLTRRYYGNRGLSEVTARGGRRAAGSSPPSTTGAGERASAGRHRRRHRRAAGRDRRGRPELAAGVADTGWSPTCTSRGRTSRTPTRWPRGCGELLDRAARCPTAVRRITITVAGTSGAVMHHHFTFRPGDAGLAEDRLIRGLHPQIAQRLQLHAAARVRPDPAAVRGRGDLPVQGASPAATRPTSGSSRWPRSAT